MAAPDVGYFSFELEELKLLSRKEIEDDFTVKVDVEISGTGDIKWTKNNLSTTSTDAAKPFKQRAKSSEETVTTEGGGDTVNEVSYLLGFNGFYRRSSYIDLTVASISSFAKAVLTIKVICVKEIILPPPTNSKNAVAPPPQIVEEVVFQLSIPLYSLISCRGNSVQGNYCFDPEQLSDIDRELGINVTTLRGPIAEAMIARLSSITWSVAADDDFAEYVMGGSVLRWAGATLSHPPVAWALQSPDVPEPKAKVQPTEADFRRKYLENISKLVSTQQKVASFVMSVDMAAGTEANATATSLESLLPTLSLSDGAISFDNETAVNVPIGENIRARQDLWTVTWGPSTPIFLHRSQVRLMASIISSLSPAVATVRITKTPAVEATTAGGAAVEVLARVDVSGLVSGATKVVCPLISFFKKSGENQSSTIEEFAQTSLEFMASLTSPLVPPKPALDVGDARPADIVSFKQLTLAEGARDVMKELRAEIVAVVKVVAHEYVNQYPLAQTGSNISYAGNPGSGGAATSSNDRIMAAGGPNGASGGERAVTPGEDVLADRKAQFLHYLSSSGVYHSLKERLKPKIQRAARDKYGPRGQALNKVEMTLASDESRTDTESKGEAAIDKIISELYVTLVKECSTVLNELYTSTLIDRDARDLDTAAAIDDEKETPSQLFRRLLEQAEDAEADGRLFAAEQLHLERIQLVGHESSLGSEPTTVHNVYARYGEFCLRCTAKYLSLVRQAQSDTSISPTDAALLEAEGCRVSLMVPDASDAMAQLARGFASKGREALEIAFAAKYNEWRPALLLAAVLVECGQLERADSIFSVVLDAQLAWSGLEGKGGMTSIDDFDGYESDKLCPVQPVCYAVLAAHFSLQQQHLKARKALLLANRSFIEGNFWPPVVSHGIPRRTVVIALAQAAELLLDFGCTALGRECVSLAKLSDEAVTKKAAARGGRADTIPFVRHLLHRTQSMAYMSGASLSAIIGGSGQTHFSGGAADEAKLAVEEARVSQAAATFPEDQTRGWLCVARALSSAGAELALVSDAYEHALECISAVSAGTGKTELLREIPLKAYITAGRLLLSSGKLTEAYAYLMTGCRVYASASLFMLVGVACLRLERLDDADDALQEANLLDNRNASVWAYLSMLCLAHGPQRLEEAQAALAQALRLGVGDPVLLREMATSYMAADKLHTAEDLVRRAIALEVSQSSLLGSGRASSLTRKLLGDILATENQVVLAVEEYQRVIGDDSADIELRRAAAGKCATLLSTLGREEELRTLKGIMNALNARMGEPQEVRFQ